MVACFVSAGIRRCQRVFVPGNSERGTPRYEGNRTRYALIEGVMACGKGEAYNPTGNEENDPDRSTAGGGNDDRS